MDAKSGLIFLIAVFVGLGVFLVVFFVAIRLKYKAKLKAKIELQKNINLKTEECLASNGFISTVKFYIDDNATFNQTSEYKKCIYVDTNNKKICLIDYQNEQSFILGFEEILNYEICENGNSVTTGIGGGVGTALGGLGVGMALSKSETNKCYKQIDLIIRIKRYDVSQVIYNLISNTYLNSGVYQCDDVYKKCENSLQKVISFLEVVISENN